MNQPLVYNVKAAGQALCMSPRSVYRLINSGELKTVQILNRMCIEASEIHAFIERQKSLQVAA